MTFLLALLDMYFAIVAIRIVMDAFGKDRHGNVFLRWVHAMTETPARLIRKAVPRRRGRDWAMFVLALALLLARWGLRWLSSHGQTGQA